MPDITIPGWLLGGLNIILAFLGAFGVALWLSMIIWTFRDARARSRDVFAILLATLMTVIFGPLGLIIYFLLRPQITLAELYERSLEEEALLQDLEERPRCSGCSRLVESHWVVCPDCHTQLKRICHNCNEKLNLRWNICPSCGTGVNQTSPAPQHQSQPQPNNAPPRRSTEATLPPTPRPPVANASMTPTQAMPPQSRDQSQAWQTVTSESKPFHTAETASGPQARPAEE